MAVYLCVSGGGGPGCSSHRTSSRSRDIHSNEVSLLCEHVNEHVAQSAAIRKSVSFEQGV